MVIEPGQTVGAFSVFVDLDDSGTIVIYAFDVRPTGFPEDPS